MITMLSLLAATAVNPTAVAQDLFEEGLVSTDSIEYAITFSADGNTALFTRRASFRDPPSLRLIRRQGGSWSTPETVPFTSEQGDELPSFSPDGSRLYFSSRRPTPGTSGPAPSNDMWMVPYSDGNWGEPQHLGGELSTDGIDSHPYEARDGRLYFHSRGRSPAVGNVDIYRTTGTYPNFGGVELIESLSSDRIDGEFVIASNGRFGIFYSDRSGSGDLFISERDGDGWASPRLLPPSVNSAAAEWAPSLSPGGRTLYFGRLTEDWSDSDIYTWQLD